MKRNCKGNVLVYILLAIALLATLTYSITTGERGQQQNQLTTAQTKLLAGNLIKQAVAAEQALYTMTQFGANYDGIKFDVPGAVGYSTDVTNQIYHPSGGGLEVFNVNEQYFDGIGTNGWTFQGNVNVGWSSTSATDLIYSFINVSEDICENLNLRLLGVTTIPTTTVNFANTLAEGGSDDDFTSVQCPECAGVHSQCISDGTTHAFYTTIGSR